MNIAMLGAGAMGCLFGGLLSESGQRVTLLDIDDAQLDAIRSHGLRLETDRGDRRIHGMSALRPEQCREAPDLLILFTKSLHTDAALRGVKALIGAPTRVLTLQNGLGNLEAVTRHVDPARVLVGMTTWPADLAGPGHVSSHGTGVVRLRSAVVDDVANIPANEAADNAADIAHISQVLDGAGLRCEVDTNVWKAIWEKVAFNAALNSLCAVTACSVGQLDLVADGGALARAVVSEVIAVARATGVDADESACHASVAHAIAHHRGHKPSMLQDVLAARPTEIEAINGEVVARAHAAGVPVPHTAMLLGLVRLIQARQSDLASWRTR
ncbi:ketopantoate reductase family protein [Achromobacter piechaudii]|uniref:2-dehydropantoate 2-reductase n=1 Tax=Achromobacter piechaudii TaxID=72556 RepID=A0A6S7E663_9BURK|nr:2-dehydropantoate 2-reductase [Achromobacter piechaudii]CAB3895727.1 2-dehydropantoate 2-reductase [Achromobacter piechaudii]